MCSFVHMWSVCSCECPHEYVSTVFVCNMTIMPVREHVPPDACYCVWKHGFVCRVYVCTCCVHVSGLEALTFLTGNLTAAFIRTGVGSFLFLQLGGCGIQNFLQACMNTVSLSRKKMSDYQNRRKAAQFLQMLLWAPHRATSAICGPSACVLSQDSGAPE